MQNGSCGRYTPLGLTHPFFSTTQLQGMDMEEDGSAPEDDLDDEPQVVAPLKSDPNEDTAIESLKAADLKELEAAKKERTDLMAAELKKEREMQEAAAKKAGKTGDGGAELDVSTKFQFLLGQSEVFAHFLAGEFRLSVIESETSRGQRLQNLPWPRIGRDEPKIQAVEEVRPWKGEPYDRGRGRRRTDEDSHFGTSHRVPEQPTENVGRSLQNAQVSTGGFELDGQTPRPRYKWYSRRRNGVSLLRCGVWRVPPQTSRSGGTIPHVFHFQRNYCIS